MNRLPAPARRALDDALHQAHTAARAGDQTTRWANLEDAHILSQSAAVTHVHVHLKMLRAGLDARDRIEITGQLMRVLVAAPGSWSGRYPIGNTGRARVPATLPMPIRPDLADLLNAQRTAEPLDRRVS